MSLDLREAERLAKLLHPERYAPDGTALALYAPVHAHPAGTPCPGGWADRLEGWRRAQQGPAGDAIPDEDEVPATRDSDQPYGRVRGEA